MMEQYRVLLVNNLHSSHEKSSIGNKRLFASFSSFMLFVVWII